ncbi:serine hydrolase domain-containing protein [Streptosporangium sp. NPDC006007]|uniref:serine hydrolase domain-containing protein n=1 Tax=Streptosporangium sp. NPDC006007 TaxID=3154575 RepID=UPI0033BC2F30
MRPRWLRTLTASAPAVSLAVAAAFPAAAATPSAPRSGTKAQRAQLQQLARKLVEAGAPGVIVRVDDGRGRPVKIAEQATWTRRDHLLKAGDESRMGSNTKTMVATLVLQLVAEGGLALTDPVGKWLPGKVPNGKAITLRMLLNHTGGLFDYTEDAAVRPSMLGKDRRRWTSAKLLAVGVKHDPLFAPGTKWSYSNTGYAALGAVLERVTGASLADLVRDRIARPLGLKHTYYATDSTWHGPHARGYEPDAAHMPPSVPAGFRHFAGARHHGHVLAVVQHQHQVVVRECPDQAVQDRLRGGGTSRLPGDRRERGGSPRNTARWASWSSGPGSLPKPSASRPRIRW